MSFEELEKWLKEKKILTAYFADFLQLSRPTLTNWKHKNVIPYHIQLVVELLDSVPERLKVMQDRTQANLEFRQSLAKKARGYREA